MSVTTQSGKQSNLFQNLSPETWAAGEGWEQKACEHVPLPRLSRWWQGNGDRGCSVGIHRPCQAFRLVQYSTEQDEHKGSFIFSTHQAGHQLKYFQLQFHIYVHKDFLGANVRWEHVVCKVTYIATAKAPASWKSAQGSNMVSSAEEHQNILIQYPEALWGYLSDFPSKDLVFPPSCLPSASVPERDNFLSLGSYS